MNVDLHVVEKHLQKLIESLGSILPAHDLSELIARQLLDCIQANLQVSEDRKLTAPGYFVISFSSQKLFDQFSSIDRIPGISNALEQVALENGFSFPHTPIFHLKVDPAISPARIMISCQDGPKDLAGTNAIRTSAPLAQPELQRAQLMLENAQVFPLVKNVTNIGRREDNDLVIDRREVSRSHAQIRWSLKKYTIFDLNSTGGTYLNGQRVNHCELHPGDVISLAGVKLIFNSENDPGEKTSPIFTAKSVNS